MARAAARAAMLSAAAAYYHILPNYHRCVLILLHTCQHVKVRASSMLACSNAECSRRFCEHCLLTHLSEDVDPSCSDAWVHVAGVAGKQFKLYEGVFKALIRR